MITDILLILIVLGIGTLIRNSNEQKQREKRIIEILEEINSKQNSV